MGWETNVPAMISFYKETYQNKYQVEEEIKDHDDMIKDYTENLLIYSLGDPKNFVEEGRTLISFKEDVKDTIESLKDAVIGKFKLELLLKNFNCRGGDFVENPDYEKSIKEWLDDSYINENIKYYNEAKENEEESDND